MSISPQGFVRGIEQLELKVINRRAWQIKRRDTDLVLRMLILAGILHDVIEDCVREGWTREMLEDRIASKFGDHVLETVLAVTRRGAAAVERLGFREWVEGLA